MLKRFSWQLSSAHRWAAERVSWLSYQESNEKIQIHIMLFSKVVLTTDQANRSQSWIHSQGIPIWRKALHSYHAKVYWLQLKRSIVDYDTFISGSRWPDIHFRPTSWDHGCLPEYRRRHFSNSVTFLCRWDGWYQIAGCPIPLPVKTGRAINIRKGQNPLRSDAVLPPSW